MIPLRQVLDLRAEWLLRTDVIEKDYVLGWLLAAIASTDELATTWIFKGGTCLRKCYYETYRFSEDLDFTVVRGGPETPEELLPLFQQVSSWLYDQTGIELNIDERSFLRRRNTRGNATTLGRLALRGPTAPPTLPKVKLDITSDEAMVGDPVSRRILHPYSDGPLPVEGIQCYSIVELLSEKLRALERAADRSADEAAACSVERRRRGKGTRGRSRPMPQLSPVVIPDTDTRTMEWCGVIGAGITSYTHLVKTAVSLPDHLFADAEAAARDLNISRSQLYARALEMFLAAQEADPVTLKLDELADEFGTSAGAEAGRRLIEKGLWEW